MTGDIRLNPNTKYQTITGWEAHIQAGQTHPQFASFKNELFQRAASELGISRVRIEPRASVEHSRDLDDEFERGVIDQATYRCLRFTTENDNDDPSTINWDGFHFSGLDKYIDSSVLPMQQIMAARGEALYVVATYVAFTAQNCAGTQYHHTDPDEYAEFVLATHLHMQQKYGFVPDAWEIILEPDNTAEWRGLQIGRAIVAAAGRLEQNGFTPRFITPSNRSMGNAVTYFDDMIQVPGALKHVSELAYHRYGALDPAALQGIGNRAVQHGIRTSMLERIGAGYQELHTDLEVGRVSAWQQFALAFPTTDNGAQYYVIDSNGSIQLGSRSRFLRQYFLYVRPGAVRIDAQTTRQGLDPLAFINTGNRYVVVVKAAAQSTFTVGGLPAGTYGTTYTTAGATHVAAPDVTIAAGAELTASIPAAGVVTISRK
ncbi:MAG: hypothetical protein ACRELT_18210 [Longimicrobiales bacterium]